MKKIFHDFDSQFLTQSQIKIVFGNGGLWQDTNIFFISLKVKTKTNLCFNVKSSV
jgi:hypothetical protein